MKNCQGTSQAKAGSLAELLALLKSLMSKGAFPASMLDSVYATLSGVLGSKYSAGMNGSNMRSLVDQYLPYAISKAGGGTAAAGQTGLFGAGNRIGGAGLAGLLNGRSGEGSFFDAARTDPLSSAATLRPGELGTVGGIVRGIGGVAVTGTRLTSDEISDYFNGVIRGDNDAFSVLLWLGPGKNPMLMLEELSYAKTLHNSVILPAATYYKRIIYGDPDYPVRLGKVGYGIVSQEKVVKNLRGGPTSRHLVGQAVNFWINGVDDDKVVEDLASGAINSDYGTLALTSSIHASLPFFGANDNIIRKMLLWSDSGVPGFVGYRFS